MSSLFASPGEKGATYEHLRSSSHPTALHAKKYTDSLWATYEPYADTNFEAGLRVDFHARFWEMYLTCLLISQGKAISCPKPGPDILLLEENKKIWVEAVAPNQGQEGAPDRVPDIKIGEVQDHPEQQIILRYRAVIYEKFENKYVRYLEKNIVANDDPFIIAINSAKIQLAYPYSTVPEIVKSVFPIGHLQVHISTEDCSVIDTGYQFRPVIQKASGNDVATNIFLDEAYSKISGVLFSPVSMISVPETPGSEILFIHNPKASNPIPEGYFSFGKEYIAKEQGEIYELLTNN